jgi:alkylation response protein AidB-like acyl-CoA dehydrogenase
LGFRANASAPITLDDCEVPSHLQLTDDGAGFQAMLNVVLPLFNLGTAGTAAKLKSARFEHLGQSLGESLPTQRAQLAAMQIDNGLKHAEHCRLAWTICTDRRLG